MTPVFMIKYIYNYEESYKALLKGTLGPDKNKLVFTNKILKRSWFPKWKKWSSYYA